MTTVARPVSAVDGARKVLGKIKDLLPKKARWSLEGRDGPDEMYYLTIFSDISDSWPIRDVAREPMAKLLEKGVTLVLVFESRDALHHLGDGVETFPIDG